VIENVLPEADYNALEESFPSVEYIAKGEKIVNNRTYLANSDRVLADPDTPEPWRAFFAAHTQRSLFESAMALWRTEVERLHPEFRKAIRPIRGRTPLGQGRFRGKSTRRHHARMPIWRE
jgi:hypothetical protein